jgi:hypothetical protein
MPDPAATPKLVEPASLDALHAISLLLNTGLDKHTLALCAALIEGGGVNPLALAAIVKEAQRVGAEVATVSSSSASNVAGAAPDALAAKP